MILYLDTSAFLKLFLAEGGAHLVAEWVAQATTVFTSRLTFVEACAALGRRSREGSLDRSQVAAAHRALVDRWPKVSVVEVDEVAAGAVAMRRDLRAYDAVHLASALEVRGRVGESIRVAFCTFDHRQAAAARAEKLQVVPQN